MVGGNLPDGIGDYYDRVEARRKVAYDKWVAAAAKAKETGSIEDQRAAFDAYEAMVAAGNTGD